MRRLKWYWKVIIFSSVLLLPVFGFGGCLLWWQYSTGGCEQSWHVVTFQNNTPFPIKTVVLNGLRDYDPPSLSLTWGYNDMPLQEPIQPDQSRKSRTVITTRRNTLEQYSIFALTEDHGIVFSELYTWDELDNMRWRVVITVNYEDPHPSFRS